MMNQERIQQDILLDITSLLKKYKIPYLLTGSMAVVSYGFPRYTHDIDLIIETDTDSFEKIKALLQGLKEPYIFGIQSLPTVLREGGMWNMMHEKTGNKIDFWVVESKFFQEQFKRKRRIKKQDHYVLAVCPEDLLITKLAWSKQVMSERHIRDCAGILSLQKNKLDYDYLDKQIKKQGLEKLFKLALRTEYQPT